jgi:hypothetical protein
LGDQVEELRNKIRTCKGKRIMTPKEKDLLIAVAEGLAKLLEERLVKGHDLETVKHQLVPFRRMINLVKDQDNASNG